MKRVLLTVMFVLSLFVMCGGCEEQHRHGDRDSERWEQDQHSEHGDQDRHRSSLIGITARRTGTKNSGDSGFTVGIRYFD